MSRKQLKVLLSCCICMAGSVGIVSNCMGIFFTPISSDLGIKIGTVSIVSTMVSLSMAFFTPVASNLLEKYDYGKAMAAGGLACALAYFASSFAGNVYFLYVTGPIIGASASLFSTLPITILLNDYFGEKSGTPTGVALGFSGVAGAILNPLSSKIIVNYGWRMTFIFLGVFFLVFVVPASLWLKREKKEAVENKNEQIKTAKKLSFSMLVLVILISFFYKSLCGMNAHISSYAIEAGYSLQVGASFVSIAMIGNVLFKLLNGSLADKIGSLQASIVFCILAILSCVGMMLFKGNMILLAGSVFLYATTFSIGNVGYTLMVKAVAKDDYRRVYSITTVFGTAGYALMTSALGLLRDYGNSYFYPMIVVTIFGIVSLAGTIVLLNRKDI